VRTLLLVRHAATAATRRARFPLDEGLDGRGHSDAERLRVALRGSAEALASPARRARETAAAAGLAPTVEPAIGPCDFGSWSGRSLADVHADDPDGTAAWMSDPEAAPHGGESLAALARRVGRWLERQARLDGRAVAVTHAEVVRAAVASLLDAPLSAFWRIDVAPLSLTELHARDGRWTVTRVSAPGGGPSAAATAGGGGRRRRSGSESRASGPPRPDPRAEALA
jgi:broad specificity phosphatase PhoE